MSTLVYLVAIVVVYSILADGMDRAVERTLRSRRAGPPLGLVEEFDVRPTQRVSVLHDRVPGQPGRSGEMGRPTRRESATSAVFLER